LVRGGIIPLRLFLERSRRIRLEQFVIASGITPSNRLLARLRNCRFRPPNLSGTTKSQQAPRCGRERRLPTKSTTPLNPEINPEKYEHPCQIKDLNPDRQLAPQGT